MRIIGIELSTPRAPDLIVVAIITLAVSILGCFSASIGLIKPNYIILSTLAALGGSMASAYGVSIIKHGWRGIALVLGFVVAMLILGSAVSVLI